ncbi:MAG: fluoride efflux transporter CrcB [Rhodospirillales bacterium]|nr:fluoride efflux transporter CrcB [Rhodospirillales bacterium]
MATLLVALGGAAGSAGRYWTGVLFAGAFGLEFPLGTLIINVLGSFIIGLADVAAGANTTRLLVIVGFCGGYTTFSSFSLQTLELIRGGHPVDASLNVVLSVALCLAATIAGASVGASLRAAL